MTDAVPEEFDPRAADRLIDQWGPAVYRFCRSLTRSKEDGEDLFQETFLRTLERPGVLRDEEAARRRLFSTAASLWKSWKRRYARRSRLAPHRPMDVGTGEVDSGTDLEADYLAREERQAVRALVDALPDKYKIPTILYYGAEQSVAQIAAALRLPEGTVKTRLYRARNLIGRGLDANENG